MKKFILSYLMISGVALTANAQFKAGIHFGYGTEIERPAIGVNAEFNLMEKLSLAPDFTYYFTEKISYVTTNLWELNLNAHYYFLGQDKFKVFGLGGLNYAHYNVKSEIDIPFFGVNTAASDGKIGFNIGGGATYQLIEKLEAFSTIKYTVSSTDQAVFYVGARYLF